MFLQNFHIDLAIVLAFLKFDWSEQLVLGGRGIAGLSWAMISISGSFWAIRACLAAAAPSWFRELAGIRSLATDSAVGMELDFDLKVCRKLRVKMGEALGISACTSRSSGGHQPIWKDIYAFDSFTASFVRSVSEKEEKGAVVRVCSGTKVSKPKAKLSDFQKNMLFASGFVKVGEGLLLFFLGGDFASQSILFPMTAFYVGMTVYVVNQYNPNRDTHDIIAGRPPTSISPGGPFKIVLDIKKPTKQSLSWRIFWIVGSVISLGFYALTLYILSSRPAWTTLGWLAYSLVVYYYGCNLIYTKGESESADLDDFTPDFTSYTLQTLPHQFKSRIFNLVLATSKYESLVHVRRTESYADDSFSEDQIRSMIQLPELLQFYPAKDLVTKQVDQNFVQVDIVGILGDTLLTSTAWITGSEYTPTDLYDCCIVLFRTPGSISSSISKIPCVRVLSSPIESKEGHIPQIVPKGVPNLGYGIEWVYFIPFDEKSYLVLRRPAQFSCKGLHYAQIMSNEEITNMLVGGTLNISLTHVDQVRQTVELSHLMYKKVVELA